MVGNPEVMAQIDPSGRYFRLARDSRASLMNLRRGSSMYLFQQRKPSDDFADFFLPANQSNSDVFQVSSFNHGDHHSECLIGPNN
jgi:hypothetical protein